MGLNNLVNRVVGIFSRERSEVTDFLTGSRSAYLSEESEEEVQDRLNDEANQGFDYFVQQYRGAAQEMRARQEGVVHQVYEMVTRCLPLMLGGSAADLAMDSEVPVGTGTAGVYTGLQGIILLHRWSRFRKSVRACTECKDELESYIRSHPDEIAESTDKEQIAAEVQHTIIGGSAQDKYHHLQHLNSVMKTVAYNSSRLNGHDKEIGELKGAVLKNRLASEEASGRLKTVEKYTYCDGHSAPYETEFGPNGVVQYDRPIGPNPPCDDMNYGLRLIGGFEEGVADEE